MTELDGLQCADCGRQIAGLPVRISDGLCRPCRNDRRNAHRAYIDGLEGRPPSAEYTEADMEDWMDGDHDRYARSRDE